MRTKYSNQILHDDQRVGDITRSIMSLAMDKIFCDMTADARFCLSVANNLVITSLYSSLLYSWTFNFRRKVVHAAIDLRVGGKFN